MQMTKEEAKACVMKYAKTRRAFWNVFETHWRNVNVVQEMVIGKISPIHAYIYKIETIKEDRNGHWKRVAMGWKKSLGQITPKPDIDPWHLEISPNSKFNLTDMTRDKKSVEYPRIICIQPCETCLQTGTLPCDACSLGLDQPCKRCHQIGLKTCYACWGNKRVEMQYVVDIKWNRSCHYAKFINGVLDSRGDESRIVYNEAGSALTTEVTKFRQPLHQFPKHPNIVKYSEELMNSEKMVTDHEEATQENTAVEYRHSVVETTGYNVEYTYQGKEYLLRIYGERNRIEFLNWFPTKFITDCNKALESWKPIPAANPPPSTSTFTILLIGIGILLLLISLCWCLCISILIMLKYYSYTFLFGIVLFLYFKFR